MSDPRKGSVGWYVGITSIVSSVCGIFGSVVIYFTVTKPQLESQLRLIESQADIAEHEAANLRRPSLQITPSIVQSASVEDIREIRLRVMMENIGDAETTISAVRLKVNNGAIKGEAQDVLARTRKLFYKYKYMDDVEEALDRIGLIEEQTPPPDRYVTRKAAIDDQMNRFEESYGNHDSQTPMSTNCPHGRLFAVATSAPNVEWSDVPEARQTAITSRMLRPGQKATQEFVFVLTEYPEQHNRQWLKFDLVVEHDGGIDAAEQQESFDIVVSGLPQTRLTNETGYREVASPDAGSVWTPTAPLLPSGNH